MGFCFKHFIEIHRNCYKCENEIRKFINKEYEKKIGKEERKKLEIIWDYANLKDDRK